MLTEVELCTVKKFLQKLCRFGWVDLDFKENSDRPLQRTKSKWKRPLLLARTCLSICYLTFVIVRIPATLRLFKETNRFDDCMMHGFLILFRSAILVNHTTTVTSIEVVAELLNNVVSLNTRFGLLHFNKKYLDPNVREKLLRATVTIFTTATVFFACFFLAKPHSPGYLYSILSGGFQRNYLIFFCFLILEFWTAADVIVLFIAFILVEFVYIFSSKYWLKYLCTNRETGSGEIEVCGAELDYFGKCSLNLYHQLYILNTLQGLSFGRHFLPIYKLIAGLLSTLTFYAIVKLGYKLNLIVYLFVVTASPSSYIILIPATYAMSKMYYLSSKYQTEQLRAYLHIGPNDSLTKKERKLFLQNNKSAAIIRCKVGSLYWMEKDAKATLVQLLVSATSNLLLTFK